MKPKASRGSKAPSPVQLELLVEEESAEVALRPLLAKMFPGRDVQVQIRRFGGKPDLLGKLPNRLLGYATARARGEDIRVIVLMDRDNDDCVKLKKQLDLIAEKAGITPRSKRNGRGDFAVLNRLAVRELENWYFGDWQAVRAAFPKVPPRIPSAYRGNPDTAPGKCSDAFERVLRNCGVAISSKPEWGRRIGPHLSVEHNRSPSFNAFVTGVRELAE